MIYIIFIKDYLSYKQGSLLACTSSVKSRLVRIGVAKEATEKEYAQYIESVRGVKEDPEKDCEDCENGNENCKDCGDNQKGIKSKK